MLYIDEKLEDKVRPNWTEALSIVHEVILCLIKKDFSQPIKPYLRFGDPSNRIIAMPSYIGGKFDVAGIKWIASFPKNRYRSIPRAQAITILNSASTGEPLAILDSNFLSGMRTAAVTGIIIKAFSEAFDERKYQIGISGFGFIGQLHFEMLAEILRDKISKISVFDSQIQKGDIFTKKFSSISFEEHWQEAYDNADIFITCTTTRDAYINQQPKSGSLHLNVSLRDYFPEVINNCPHLIVDSWEEVCREGTSIENAHKLLGLQETRTHSIANVIYSNYFNKIDKQTFRDNEYAIFNPMGMAVFDIAFAKHFYDKAKELKQGIQLKENSQFA